MWTSTATGKWSRTDGDTGYLLADVDTMLELHGDTMHVYRKDPKADPKAGVGSPLDGYAWQSTEPVRASTTASVPAMDATTAWSLLGARAAQIDAARAVTDSKTPPPPPPPPISRQGS